MKKLSIVIAVIAVIVFTIWFFSRGGGESDVVQDVTTSGGQLPTSGEIPSSGESVGGAIIQPEGDLSFDFDLRSGDIEIGRAIQLSQYPVSGAGFRGERVRYIDRGTGFVYEIDQNGLNRNQLTDSSILQTFESAWSPNGDSVVLRYTDENDEVRTFAGSITGDESTTTMAVLDGAFLASATVAITASPTSDKIFYLQKNGDVYEGIVSDMDGGGKALIYSSPFGNFNIDWAGDRLVALVTKSANGIPGFAYIINTRSQTLTKLVGNIAGLTARVSPSGDHVLYSESVGRLTKTYIKNIDTGEVVLLSLQTFGDKCAWERNEGVTIYCGVPLSLGTNSSLPNSWYQGYSPFADALWEVNAETGTVSLLNRATRADITNPIVNASGTYMLYTNKTDQTLWSIRVK